MTGQQNWPFPNEDLGKQNVKSLVPDPASRQDQSGFEPRCSDPKPRWALPPVSSFLILPQVCLNALWVCLKRGKLNFFLMPQTFYTQPSMPRDPSVPWMTPCDSGTSCGHWTYRLRPRDGSGTSLFRNLIWETQKMLSVWWRVLELNAHTDLGEKMVVLRPHDGWLNRDR